MRCYHIRQTSACLHYFYPTYTPFALSDKFRLVGANEKTKEKYLEYYDRIHLKD